jgi:nucleoid-associated protein YgaU
MQKDLKTGFVLGLVMVTVAVVWLSTRPGLSTKVRMLNSQNTTLQELSDLPNERDAEDNQLSVIDTRPEHSQRNQPNVPNLTASNKSEKIETPKIHIVRTGETLSDISYKYYGSSNKWQKILDANRSQIKDANRLRPGTELIIPE